MKRLLLILCIAIISSACADACPSLQDTSLVGTWKGISVCQIRPSACHDEIAVYHITKGTIPNLYRVVMNKVVDGKEERVTVLDYNYSGGTLTGIDDRYKLIWSFKVKKDMMEGTLVFDNTVYRTIKLTKAK